MTHTFTSTEYEKMIIAGKEVFVPKPDFLEGFQDSGGRSNQSPPALLGRNDELAMVIASWMGDRFEDSLTPILVGPPGVGKSKIVSEVRRAFQSRALRRPLYHLYCNGGLEPEMLSCTTRMSDDFEKKIDYLLGPLSAALVTGGLCLLDEVDRLSSQSMAVLNPLLDDQRSLDIPALGIRLSAHPDFRLVFATNNPEAIEDSLRSRMFPTIPVGEMKRHDLDEILRARFKLGTSLSDEMLDVFWAEATRLERKTTPRFLIQVFSLAFKLASIEKPSGSEVVIEPSNVTKALQMST